jgi:hypothetical protein
MTARATSLLHKFPEQYELVESILRREPGDEIILSGSEAQHQILNVIQKQQDQGQRRSKAATSSNDDIAATNVARPALREYVLRNLDDANPCQLSVRVGDETAMRKKTFVNAQGKDSLSGEGLVIALTKSCGE